MGVLVERNRSEIVARADRPSFASMASATSALRMRGADVDCSRISIRAVRSHDPSRKATVGSVAPSHLAPCLTRWRREGWHRLGHAVYHLGIRARIPLGDHVFQDSERLLKLLVRQLLERIAVLDLVFARDKQGQTSQVHPGLLAAHLRNGLLPVLAEIA